MQQQYQQIREFLATAYELALFEVDLRPIDDLISARRRIPEEYIERKPCRGLEIVEEIHTLLEKRERIRVIIQCIVRANGKFEDAALQLNGTIKRISEKLAELDGWLLTERDRLLGEQLEPSQKPAWVD